MNKLNKIEGELPAGRYDSHVHVFPGRPDPEGYVKRLAEAGFDIPGLRFCCAWVKVSPTGVVQWPLHSRQGGT